MSVWSQTNSKLGKHAQFPPRFLVRRVPQKINYAKELRAKDTHKLLVTKTIQMSHRHGGGGCPLLTIREMWFETTRKHKRQLGATLSGPGRGTQALSRAAGKDAKWHNFWGGKLALPSKLPTHVLRAPAIPALELSSQSSLHAHKTVCVWGCSQQQVSLHIFKSSVRKCSSVGN